MLPDPFTKQTMWVAAALAAGNLQFETAVPTVTPVTGATITFPTPIDITSPVYSVQIQQTPTGAWSAATLSGSPSVSGGLTTLTISGLTASTTYNAIQVTATGANATVTGPQSAPFTAS
ncbi:hypothetical protein MBOT_20240 [Mycobacterium botniense]|uniref:Fibronectin type-III domain-containing protein n=1 Tax=Mycobacterium botniense TaxID=84962 RepID=A0A7I9XXX8_9MYCO|nr:hypothetical protein MBOT_20240 [Mycobacterium botniense]